MNQFSLSGNLVKEVRLPSYVEYILGSTWIRLLVQSDGSLEVSIADVALALISVGPSGGRTCPYPGTDRVRNNLDLNNSHSSRRTFS